MAQFERAVGRDPTAAVAWVGLGSALVNLGRAAEGIEKLERAITLAPAMVEAHYLLGMGYRALGQPDKAAAALKRAGKLRAR